CQVGDRGRWQRADEIYVDSGADKARLERRLEHVPRQACVLANQRTPARGRQYARRRARKAQREVDRHRVIPDPASHTVRAEVLSRHDQLLCKAAPRSAAPVFTASTVAAMSCARTIATPRSAQSAASATLPASRSPAARPVMIPISDLRETPISTGLAPRVNTPRLRSRARLCSARLPKPIPGSMQSRSRGIPAATQ